MGCFTGLSRTILIIFNVILGLASLAAVGVLIFGFTSAIVRGFAGASVLGGVLGGFALLLILSIVGLVGAIKKKRSLVGIYSIFVFLFFAASIASGVFLSGVDLNINSVRGGFQIVSTTTNRNAAVEGLIDDLFTTFENVYDNGKCSGGGIATTLAPALVSAAVFSDVSCESGSIQDILRNFERIPSNQAEYGPASVPNSWMECMAENNLTTPISQGNANARTGLWCRANSEIVRNIAGILRTLVIASWVSAGILFLLLISSFTICCRSRESLKKSPKKGPIQHPIPSHTAGVQQGNAQVVYV